MSSPRKITLKTFDGETFEVEETVALESKTLKNMIDDGCADGVIPLPNVSSSILAKVTEYCKRHTESRDDLEAEDRATKAKEDLRAWDAEFVKADQPALIDLILAANYLNIQGLLDLTSQTATEMIKDMSPEEVRVVFDIVCDFTPEEEAEIRKENAWAFT